MLSSPRPNPGRQTLSSIQASTSYTSVYFVLGFALWSFAFVDENPRAQPLAVAVNTVSRSPSPDPHLLRNPGPHRYASPRPQASLANGLGLGPRRLACQPHQRIPAPTSGGKHDQSSNTIPNQAGCNASKHLPCNRPAPAPHLRLALPSRTSTGSARSPALMPGNATMSTSQYERRVIVRKDPPPPRAGKEGKPLRCVSLKQENSSSGARAQRENGIRRRRQLCSAGSPARPPARRHHQVSARLPSTPSCRRGQTSPCRVVRPASPSRRERRRGSRQTSAIQLRPPF